MLLPCLLSTLSPLPTPACLLSSTYLDQGASTTALFLRQHFWNAHSLLTHMSVLLGNVEAAGKSLCVLTWPSVRGPGSRSNCCLRVVTPLCSSYTNRRPHVATQLKCYLTLMSLMERPPGSTAGPPLPSPHLCWTVPFTLSLGILITMLLPSLNTIFVYTHLFS